MIEKIVHAVKSISLANVGIFALVIAVSVPAYFAYRFISDVDFRREFMSTAIILDRHVPCVVLEGHKYGGNKRHSVLVVYGIEGRQEKLVGLRSPTPMSADEINETCGKVAAMAEGLKDAPAR